MIEPVQVEAYSSYAYAVEPRAYSLRGERHTIESIDRQWRTPGQIHFRVREEGGGSAELIYNETKESWLLRGLGTTHTEERDTDEHR